MMSRNIVHQSYQYFFYYFDLIRPFIQLSSSSEIPSSLTILLTYSSSGRTVQNNLNISIHRKKEFKILMNDNHSGTSPLEFTTEYVYNG